MTMAACAKDPAAQAEPSDTTAVAAAASAAEPAADSHASHNSPAVDTTVGDGLSAELRADLASLEKASAAQASAALPVHRQLVANTIASFNAEMRGMNMPMDAAWNATVDSLRKDLVSLAAQTPTGLQSIIPPHVGRVRRLGTMHATMLASMKH